MINENKYILLTVDVEDWFQVENFKPWIPFETWDQRELRVERNVHRLLDLFDESEFGGQKLEVRSQVTDFRGQEKTELRQRRITPDQFHPENDPDNKKSPRSSKSCLKETTKNGIKSTFFILAWIAEKLPHLVREIHSRGHEVASHGCNHQLSNQLSHDALKSELNDSRKILEDIIGAPVKGFRAPSFSISNYVMGQIEESGYLYDSSLNSFKMHNRYGQIDLSANNKKGIALKVSDTFFELPLSNLKLMDKVIPWGGGAYFRIIPYRLFRRGVQSILKKDGAYVFYMHPWEVDPEQPKVNQASFSLKFRHYKNLNKTTTRLKSFMASFDYCQFVTCSQYINEIEKSGEAGKLESENA